MSVPAKLSAILATLVIFAAIATPHLAAAARMLG